MRIIHLVRNNNWGGGERYVRDLCEFSENEGHKVTLITRGIPSVDAGFSDLKADIHNMRLGGFFDFDSPKRLARLISGLPENKVVVHVHNFKDAEIACRAKRIVGKKKCLTVICTRHLVKHGKRSLRWKWIFRHIDRIVFVSELAMNEFLATAPPVEREKLCVVHNSILLPDRYSEPVPYSMIPVSESRKLLFTGRIVPEKGIEVLIKSLALLRTKDVQLSILGSGDKEYLSRLKELALSLGVSNKIEWKGFTDNVFPEIVRSEICVAPSLWKEPFGLTIIEFMSQGRAVVTTLNGAQKEIITDGKDGILVEPDSAEELAKAIDGLLDDRQKCIEIGEQASITFRRKFSYPAFFSKMIAVYREGLLETECKVV